MPDRMTNRRQIIAHWHDAFEIIRVLEGALEFRIGERAELLQTGECLFINSRQMHASMSNNSRYICVLAGRDLFSGSRWVRDELIGPLVSDSDFAHALLDSESARMVDKMYDLYAQGNTSKHIEMLGLLYLVMARVSEQHARHSGGLITPLDNSAIAEISAQKDMLSFISQHFDGKITLADIASAGCVCRSRCCSIFKKYLRQSPIEFLNSYRLTASLSLLRDTDLRIADIALSCGFGHQSYYTKIFGRKYGCTPNEYRSRTRAA